MLICRAFLEQKVTAQYVNKFPALRNQKIHRSLHREVSLEPILHQKNLLNDFAPNFSLYTYFNIIFPKISSSLKFSNNIFVDIRNSFYIPDLFRFLLVIMLHGHFHFTLPTITNSMEQYFMRNTNYLKRPRNYSSATQLISQEFANFP